MCCCKTEKFIQVEYDEEFVGDNYSGVGKFALVKVCDIDRLGSVEKAFEETSGIGQIHIIHYSEDDLYDSRGEGIEG